MKGMTLPQMQGHLQQILLDDHPLTAEQRYSIKSAIEIMDLVQKMAPGFEKANKAAESHKK